MGKPVPMEARAFCKLLQRWGFTILRTSGGHQIWTHPEKGGRVITTSAGRKTFVHGHALDQAAEVLGLPPAEVLRGP